MVDKFDLNFDEYIDPIVNVLTSLQISAYAPQELDLVDAIRRAITKFALSKDSYKAWSWMKFLEDFMDLPLHTQTLNQLTDHARRVSDSIELFKDPTGGGEAVAAEGEKLQGFAYLSHGQAQAGHYGSQYDSGYHAYNAYAGYHPAQEAEEPDLGYAFAAGMNLPTCETCGNHHPTSQCRIGAARTRMAESGRDHTGTGALVQQAGAGRGKP
eukprot:3941999-Rhodomonas_salina.3